MTPEGIVKQQIDRILKFHHVWYFKPRGTVMGRSGIPDYICVKHGTMFTVEAKAHGNLPTALQTKEMTSLRAQGIITFVINENNLDELEEYVKSITLKNPEGWPPSQPGPADVCLGCHRPGTIYSTYSSRSCPVCGGAGLRPKEDK